MEKFVKNKKKSDKLFDKITACDINSYLKTFDKDLTAKVFRTRLASNLMYKELQEQEKTLNKKSTDMQKKKVFDFANSSIARVLNHQRSISKKAEDTVLKYEQDLKELKKN